MTIAVDWDVKNQTKQTKVLISVDVPLCYSHVTKSSFLASRPISMCILLYLGSKGRLSNVKARMPH